MSFNRVLELPIRFSNLQLVVNLRTYTHVYLIKVNVVSVLLDFKPEGLHFRLEYL